MGQGLIYFDYHSINNAVRRKKIHEKCDIGFSEVFKIFSGNPFFAHLDKNKKHIIGWPFFKQLNGYSFDDVRFRPGSAMGHYTISSIDKHPNKIGQELFADQFIKKYIEVYQ